MIEGLYETHIQVSNLENAVQFYTQILGLEFAHYDETRPIAFLWIGENKKAMLGLGNNKEISIKDILHSAVPKILF